VQRKKCRLTVGLSRISSISKDERAENLTSAQGGQRSRYATDSTSSRRHVHSANDCHLNVVTQLTQFVGHDVIYG